MTLDDILAAARRQGVTVVVVNQTIYNAPHIEAGNVEIGVTLNQLAPPAPQRRLTPDYEYWRLRREWEREHAGDAYAVYSE